MTHSYVTCHRCEALEGNTSIEAVDFDHCGFGDEGCAMVEQVCVAAYCSALRSVAVCCSVLQ